MRIWAVAFALLIVAACGARPAQSDSAQVGPPQGEAAIAASAAVAKTEPPRNLLTLAEGAVVASASENAADAPALTDGADGTNWSVGGPRFSPPFRFVFELRAPTRLARVGVEGAGARPGGVAGASAKTVRIEGSAVGPDAGFSPIGTVVAREDGETLIDVSLDHDVRWLRYTIEGNQSGATWTYLDGVVAYGAQTPPADEGRFTGVFVTGRNGLVELRQTGSSITGCFVEIGGFGGGEITGAVGEGVARLMWRNDQGITGPAFMVIDASGKLSGVRYRDRSRSAWGGPRAPAGATTPCSAVTPPANPIAAALESQGEARIYEILFDFDRATLKPSSEPALRQLLDALRGNAALSVDIEGHTDAAGENAYNLSLSERRARSVVAWLVDHGIAASRLNAVGKGETEPVASNDTADGRALNRRVEVARR